MYAVWYKILTIMFDIVIIRHIVTLLVERFGYNGIIYNLKYDVIMIDNIDTFIIFAFQRKCGIFIAIKSRFLHLKNIYIYSIDQ